MDIQVDGDSTEGAHNAVGTSHRDCIQAVGTYAYRVGFHREAYGEAQEILETLEAGTGAGHVKEG